MQLDLLAPPLRQPKGEEFPATRFLCDVERYRMRLLTRDELRRKWAAGEYAGVPADYAKWVMGA